MVGRNIFQFDKKLKNCPFCGSEAKETEGIGGINMICCMNYKGCGAMVTFDNKLCNENPEATKTFFNKRAKEQ